MLTEKLKTIKEDNETHNNGIEPTPNSLGTFFAMLGAGAAHAER